MKIAGIFLTFGMLMPIRFKYVRPYFKHEQAKRLPISGEYASQPSTAIGWGPLRICIVWNNPKR
jgi:hypothetical protein